MQDYASSRNPYGSGFGQRVEEAVDDVAYELRSAVAYVDRVVVPQVRRESSGALRLLAGHLEKLANTLHPYTPKSDAPSSSTSTSEGSAR